MKNQLVDIKSINKKELIKVFEELGQPSFRASQIFDWLYKIESWNNVMFDDMTNLSTSLRNKLASMFFINKLKVNNKQKSSDGSVKYVFTTFDGVMFETVAIPEINKDKEPEKNLTVCVSTQAGCKMKCSFCATGKQKFYRNLNIGEIVDQVFYVTKDLNTRVSNVVIMGQGEPFQNYKNVKNALDLLNNKKYLNIGARKITVSTCGVLNGIKQFSEIDKQYGLAISLHSCIQNTRDMLMPGVVTQPLDELRNTIKQYIAKTNRRPTFEYVLLQNVNDDENHLKALSKYCKGLLCHVNLLHYNKVEGCPYFPSPKKRFVSWKTALENEGIAVSVRKSRGEDIEGACGQLINR